MSLVSRRHRLLLLAMLALAGAAGSVGVAVNAMRDSPPLIRPYDPLW